MHLKERIWEDVYWIRMDEDRNQWPALVNTAMDVREFIENPHEYSPLMNDIA
jgi:hypothetical protein